MVKVVEVSEAVVGKPKFVDHYNFSSIKQKINTRQVIGTPDEMDCGELLRYLAETGKRPVPAVLHDCANYVHHLEDMLMRMCAEAAQRRNDLNEHPTNNGENNERRRF